MTLHRIEHALVMDTDDIPDRGGYAVVGISSRVPQVDRAFIAGNFGISDYLHDPKTENRIFYSVFPMPSGQRAFVRRFARGTELRRNNTQRRLVVHTLLLDEEVWTDLYALPWLLLNARLQIDGTREPYRLNTEVSWVDEGTTLPALLWDSTDGAAADVAAKLTNRLTVVGKQLAGPAREPRDVIARVITALGSQSRVTLPQDPGYEWVTMLAWSMLPRHDRDELAWTQHDSMNLSGVAFPLANSATADADPALPRPAAFAQELVRMNTESEDTWLDLQERTARHPLTVRQAGELDSWMKWREALLRLGSNIHAPEHEVVAYMTRLAEKARANPNAPWIDGEEVLHLVWKNVSDARAHGHVPALAATTWGDRLRTSGLGDVIFRAAPSPRWLTRAAEDVGANALVRFFIYGGGDDAASKPTRTAIVQWLVESPRRDVDSKDLARLAFLVAADRSSVLRPLLEVLLSTSAGLDALLAYLRQRQGGVDLVHAALPLVLAGKHPSKTAFLRDVFLPRFEAHRIDFEVARDIAIVLRDDRPAFHLFAAAVTSEVRAQLLTLVREWVEYGIDAAVPLASEILARMLAEDDDEAAVDLAIALANAGEPARTWFDVLVRMIRRRADVGSVLQQIKTERLNLKGAMEQLVPLLEKSESGDAVRALILFVRAEWGAGTNQFVHALRRLVEDARFVRGWSDIVVAYAHDHRHKRTREVSELAAAYWAQIAVDPTQLPSMTDAEIRLLDLLDAAGVQRLKQAWTPKMGVMPRCPASDRLLAIIRERSYSQEITLAIRDIDQRQADAGTLNRLEVALAKVHRGKGVDMFADEVEKYLGAGGPAARLACLLDLLALDEILPSVRFALTTRVLGKRLKAMKRRHWKELRVAAREENLLALGAVMRLAYAVGAHADRRTGEEFEAVWRAHRRRDALDALEAGRLERGPRQWLARFVGMAPPPALGWQ